MKSLWTLALAAVVWSAVGDRAVTAAPLPVGSAQFPVAAEPGPAGGMVIASQVSPFSVPGSFSGTLTTDVISGDASNPLGGLTFVYSLVNSVGPNSIGRFSVDGYLSFATDVSYDSTSGGKAPAFADRNPFGDVIGFSFLPSPADPNTGFLSPGSTARRMVIQTAATRYHGVQGSLIDGGVIVATALGPLVPEPATIVLAGLGGLAVLGFARRRRV